MLLLADILEPKVIVQSGVSLGSVLAVVTSWQRNRSFISGDAVYYVRDGHVWGTSWSTPSQVNGPY